MLRVPSGRARARASIMYVDQIRPAGRLADTYAAEAAMEPPPHTQRCNCILKTHHLSISN